MLKPAFLHYGPQYKPRQLNIAGHEQSIAGEAPLISIVVPSLNQGRFLERTLTSILDQQYPRLELLVVDGGSTDESLEIIKKYSDRISWWCSEADAGQTSALNKGFAHSTGEIMAWLNADDCLLPGCLTHVANWMIAHPKADVVYGLRVLLNEHDQDIGRWILPAHSYQVMSWADFIPQETLFWRREMWNRSEGRLDESFDFAMDWELLLRFRHYGACFYRLPYFLGGFRIHPGQKTADSIETGLQEMQRLRRRYLGRKLFNRMQNVMAMAAYLFKARMLELLWRYRLIKYN